MKVLHVIPSLWDGDGGPSQALASMERALVARGVCVETLTTDDAGRGVRNGKVLGVPLQENGSVRRYFKKQTDFYKVSMDLARWLTAHVRDYELLHLHALFTFSTTAAARIARRNGVPYIVRPLGTLDAWGLAMRRPVQKRISLALIERPLLRHAAFVHFTSNAEAVHAQALGLAIRPAVIPLGIETPQAARSTRAWDATRPLRVLYLSRLAPKKNVAALLDAIAELRRDGTRLALRIAGDGDPGYVRGLHQRADDLGLTGIVQWLGDLRGEVKEAAFAAADVFVLPSRSENFGIAAAEALAHGLPCILGRGVAIAAQVQAQGAGIAIEPGAAEIAAALKLMIAPGRRAAMSVAASRLARERFSPEAMGMRLEQLYTHVVSRRHEFPAER